MPNVATVLKDEIARLAKKEVKRLVDPLRKQVQSQRHDIASLKKDRAALQAEVKRLSKGAARAQAATSQTPANEDGRQVRFSAGQCKTLRNKLGLSQESLGLLVGVSGPSAFAWEAGVSRPKPDTLAKIGELRKLGKREVADRLATLKAGRKVAAVKKAGGTKKVASKRGRKAARK